MNHIIRELKKEEYYMLRDFLYEAIYIPEGIEPPPVSVIDLPELQEYIAGFGTRKNDKALAAVCSGRITGVIWARIMNDYGHIESSVPSLAMSVLKEYRRKGIGTALLKQMLCSLRASGFSKVSLSVQKLNYAVKMYEKAGFHIIKESGEEYIMAAKLK